MIRLPKNDDKYVWTVHAIEKMRYYRLSESLVKRVMRFPKRVEKAIAPRTIGAMQPKGTAKNPREVWVMYQELKSKTDYGQWTMANSKDKKAIVHSQSAISGFSSCRKKIISAWIYPGVTKPGDPIPVPEEYTID